MGGWIGVIAGNSLKQMPSPAVFFFSDYSPLLPPSLAYTVHLDTNSLLFVTLNQGSLESDNSFSYWVMFNHPLT